MTGFLVAYCGGVEPRNGEGATRVAAGEVRSSPPNMRAAIPSSRKTHHMLD
jgi:hypothetical protein